MKLNHSLSDFELIKAYCDGSEDALSIIYQRYAKKMLLYSYRICECEEVSSDSVSEVFEKLIMLPLDKRKELLFSEDFTEVQGLLYAMTYNKTMDLLRKKVARSKQLLLFRKMFRYVRPRSFIDTAQADFERLTALLTKREQEAITLFREGYEYKQIAAQMDVSVNTVKTLISRGKEKIKSFNQ